GLRITMCLPGEQEKSRKVLMVVFEVGTQSACAINRCGDLAGDGRGAGGAELGKHFDAASRVVKRNLLHSSMLRKESAALGERDGMRIHLAQVAQGGPREGNEIVHDPKVHLTHDMQIVFEQKVVIFVYRAC